MSLIEFFAVGTLGFFALIAVEIILLFVFTANDNGWGALFSVVGFLALIEFFSKVRVLHLIWQNPLWIIVFAAGYVVLGLCWAIFKWRNKIKNKIKDLRDLFTQFLLLKKLPLSTTILETLELRKAWSDYVNDHKVHRDGRYVKLTDTLEVGHYKSNLFHWWALWPISLLIFIFKDMVREFFNWCYDCVKGFLQRMADELYAKENIKQNLDLTPDKTEDDSQG